VTLACSEDLSGKRVTDCCHADGGARKDDESARAKAYELLPSAIYCRAAHSSSASSASSGVLMPNSAPVNGSDEGN
jgi:hypothetical protein